MKQVLSLNPQPGVLSVLIYINQQRGILKTGFKPLLAFVDSSGRRKYSENCADICLPSRYENRKYKLHH